MGPEGLYGFVHRHPELLTEHRLQDTKLVIDGNSLLRHLYDKLDRCYGGEYPEYRKKCIRFFDNLQQCDITAYVVFDGAWDPNGRKYTTYLNRHQQKLNAAKAVSTGRGWSKTKVVIPVFALHILQDVASKMEGVFTVTSDFEAVDEIVALAHYFECPVLGSDSDFFVYPLKYGYITFASFKWQNVETMIEAEDGAKRQKSQYLLCSIFVSQEELCNIIGITKDKLFLFATIRGNDYLQMNMLKPFHDNIKLPYGGKALPVLGDWMKVRQEKSVEDILDEVLNMLKLPEDKRKEVEALAKESMQVYCRNSEGYLNKVFEGDTAATAETSSTAVHLIAQEEASSSAQITTTQSSMSATRDNYKDSASGQTSKQVIQSTSAQTMSDNTSAKSTSNNKATVRYENLGLPANMIQNLRKGTLHSMWVNVFAKGEFISLKQVEVFRLCSANDLSKDIRAAMYGILLESGKFKTVKEYDRETGNGKVAENEVAVPQELPQYGKLPSLDTISELSQEERMRLILAALDQTAAIPDIGLEDHLQLPMAVTRYWFSRSKCNDYFARSLIIGFLLHSDEDKMKVFNEQLTDFHYANEGALHAYAQWQSCLVYANELNVLLNYPLPQFDIAKLFSGRKNHQLAEIAEQSTSKNDPFHKTLDGFPSMKERYMKLWKYMYVIQH